LGVTQVFSSGNGGGNFGYPASQAAVNPGIVVVGAINNAGQLTPYHSRGDLMDIVAPSNDFRTGPGGEQIYLRIDSTDRRGAAGYAAGDYTGTGSTGFGGTSASAPIVAGVAALAISRAQDLNIDLTATDIRRSIRNNTQLAGGVGYDPSTGRSFSGGFGLIDAGSLVSGIGSAQMSVTTTFAEVTDGSSGWTFGEVFVGSINEGIIRIRNQGTEALEVTNISISGGPGFSVTQVSQASLGLGDATTFALTFNPLTAGAQSTVVTITSDDPTTPIFTFEIEATALAPNAYGFVFEDRNGDGVKQSGESPLAGRTVFADTNNNAVIDTFNTQSFVNSTPVTIPLVEATVISTLNVSGLTDYVTDINVSINITHTWIGDLAIFLESPTGELSLLINQRGGSGDNMVNTIFDDSAALAIGQGAPPFTGSFRPETPLAVFNGLPAAQANGTWTLYVLDLFDEDGGTLNNWELTIGTGEYSTLTDSFGYYAVDGLSSGSYTVRLASDANWTAAPGATTSYPVVLPNPTFSDLNLGIGRNNRFYAQVFEDVNGNGLFDPGEAGRANRTLFVDGNNNGVLDGEVISDWFSAPGTPFGGQFGTPPTIVSNQTVSGLAGNVLDINVTVNLDHFWINDIRITLLAPNGSEVILFNRRGGNGEDMVNTVFDDSAEVSITTAVAANAPFTGSWRPEQPLSSLNGIDPNGTWGLRIQDFFTALDDGVLNNWTLSILTSADVAFETGADGWAAIDLDNGTYDILLTDGGLNFTVPLDGKRVVTAAGLPIFNQTYGEGDSLPSSTIVGSFVYHGGYSGAGSPIDTGKTLAKESQTLQTLTFENLINTSRGINGLAFDIENLPGALSAADFVFQVSPFGAFNQSLNPPTGWIAGPAPSFVSVTPGTPDRVLIEWPNGAIANRWLRITVLANANTGLSQPEVYYIGHLLGETTGASGGVFTVQFNDVSAIRAAAGSTVNASSTLDIDKNGNVTFADISVMRPNIGAQLTAISIQAPGPLLMSSPGSGGNGRDIKIGGLVDWSDAAPAVEPVRFSQSATVGNPGTSGRESSIADSIFGQFALSSSTATLVGEDKMASNIPVFPVPGDVLVRSVEREAMIGSLDRIFEELGQGEELKDELAVIKR
jgi:subtilisin-like proprotein convertase family protein